MIITWKLLNVTSRIAKVRMCIYIYINKYIFNVIFIRLLELIVCQQRDECVKRITKGSSIGIITNTSIKRRCGYYRRRVNWE